MNKLKSCVTNYYVKRLGKKFPLTGVNMEGDTVNKFRVFYINTDFSSKS